VRKIESSIPRLTTERQQKDNHSQVIDHRTSNFSHAYTAIFAVFAPKQDGSKTGLCHV